MRNIFDIEDIGPGNGLVFVNSGGSTLASAAGISVSDDLIVVAYIGWRTLTRMQFFSNKNRSAWKACPYFELFQKRLIEFDNDFPRGRVLLDAATQSGLVGFNPEEVTVTEKGGAKFVPVPAEGRHSPEEILAWLSRENVLHNFFTLPKAGEAAKPRNVFAVADEVTDSPEAMVRYFWNSLRTVNGHKTFKAALGRAEPIRAVVYALAAESIASEKAGAK